MNLKYYLRGLGLGIVITAVLLGVVAGGRQETLTDEEIVARAKELGMMEDSLLSEYVEKAKADTEARLREEIEGQLRDSLYGEIRAEVETELGLPLPGDTGENGDSGEAGDAPEGTAEAAGTEGAVETSGPDSASATDSVAESVEFTVNRGDTPQDVSRRLEEAGLVESASKFSKFLLDNGYDRLIVAANYRIPEGADEEMVAKIITKTRD